MVRVNTGKGTGAIRAFGEHKGSGLALMCELLGGALTGNGASQLSQAMVAGHVFVLHRRDKGRSGAFLPGRSHAHDRLRKASKPLTAGEDVLVPGEQEERYRAERLENGIPLPDDTWASLLSIAREVGIDGGRLQKIELL